MLLSKAKKHVPSPERCDYIIRRAKKRTQKRLGGLADCQPLPVFRPPRTRPGNRKPA